MKISPISTHKNLKTRENNSSSQTKGCIKKDFTSSYNIEPDFVEHLRKSHSLLNGQINNITASIKISESKGIFIKSGKYTGVLGKNRVNLQFKATPASTTFNGQIGEEKINVKFKHGFIKNYIEGQIGHDSINITIPATSTKEAKGKQDILTLLASLNNQKFLIKNNTFKGLDGSDQLKSQVGKKPAYW